MAPVVPTGTAAIAVPGAAPPVQPEAYAAAAQHQHVPSGMQSANQTAEFFLSNYRLGKTLGIGSFGKVKVAEHILTGHKVAIKILNRRKIQAMDMEEKVRREIKILRLFMHPHIIRLYEVIETPTDIYVVMEYVKGGELFDHIVEKGRLAEDDARRFFQQIISGVEYCHRNMVVHRDLKPENLLLDSNLAVKIADFGLSNVMRDGHFLKTSCGSPNYAAPEVISGKLYAGPEVDVWSCGVILYALLCGSLPFDDENIPNLFKKIKGGIYNLPSHLSPGARDLIPRMLLVDPLKRITLPEVRQHPWFTAHLPRYLAVMQADTGASHMRLDEECVQEVVRLGFDRQLLLDSLRARQQNKATVTYYLLADNRRGLSASAYLSGELNEGGAAASAAAAAAAGWGRSASLGGPSTAGAGRDSTGGGLPQQRLVAERKWRLGLGLRGHPSALMGEVYRALAATGCGWKKLGPYALKCRKVVVVHPSRLSRMSEDGASDMSGAGGNGREPGATSSSSSGGGPGGGGAVEDMASETSPGLGGQPAHPHLLRPTTSASGGPGTAVTSSFAGGHPGGGTPGAPTAGSGSGAGGSGRPPPAAVLTPDGSGVEYLVKFELALYKVREEEYALDVQRLEGEMLVYLDVAGRLLGEIRA